MATIRPTGTSELQEIIRSRKIRPTSTEEILGDFNLFRPAWEAGYFKSDLGAGEMLSHGATTILGGIWDFVKHESRYMGTIPPGKEAEDPDRLSGLAEYGRHKERSKALTLQAIAEVGLGYEAIGVGGKRLKKKLISDEYTESDARSAWDYYRHMARIESDRQQGAKIMAFTGTGEFLNWLGYLPDEFREKMMRDEVKVPMSAAIGASLLAAPTNWASGAIG